MPELENTFLKQSANLKAYYRLENGALTIDSSGNGYTLTNTGSAGETAGVFGGAVEFSGSNSLSLSDNLGLGKNNWSATFWLKRNDTASSDARVLFIGSAGSNGLGLILSNGGSGAGNKLVILYGGVKFVDTGVEVTDTSLWHHISLTRDSSTTKVYFDGTLVKSDSSTPNDPSSSIFIGNALKGNIDDLALFNRALTPSETKELYGYGYGELRPGQFGTTGGLWHLNGGGTDDSGNENHGTATNVSWGAGKLGKEAGVFNGSTSRIEIADNANLNKATHTIMAWIKPRVTMGSNGMVVEKYIGPYKGYDIRVIGSNKVNYTVYNGGGGIVCQSGDTITVGAWNFIACTFDGTNLKNYINGSLSKTTAFSGTISHSTGYFGIGRSLAYGNQPFDGAIDEVVYLGTALTQNQIRQIYLLQSGKLNRYA